ncbi:serine hydrolase [Streptomyces thioluteus]|uniref:serine hydrolase n=1 Tax=Streptomyces thioluteus TaxID=66431 RepID=UPI003CD0A863
MPAEANAVGRRRRPPPRTRRSIDLPRASCGASTARHLDRPHRASRRSVPTKGGRRRRPPLLLHQRWLVDLDAPVGTYWPEFRPPARSASWSRHLLAHRAGVPVRPTPRSPRPGHRRRQRSRAPSRPMAPVVGAGDRSTATTPRTYSWPPRELVLRITGRDARR